MKKKPVVCNSAERIRKSGRMKRWSVLLLVFGAFSLSFSALSPLAFAEPTALWLEESPFTHSDGEFVHRETIAIHVEGPEGDIYDIMIIFDPGGMNSLKRLWDDRTVPVGGEIVLSYEIPDTAIEGGYEVQVWSFDSPTFYFYAEYVVVSFDDVVLDLILEIQNDIADLTNQMTLLQQNLSEWNISQLQTEVSNLQSSFDDLQREFNGVVGILSGLNFAVNDLQEEIQELQAQIRDLEDEQTSTASSLGANDLLTYLALILGIAGLIIGLMAMFRKRPTHPQEAPMEQPIEQP